MPVLARFVARFVTLFALALSLPAQAENYPEERAASFESARLMPLVKNLMPAPAWIDGEDRFWVKNESADGHRFVVVDVATGKQRDAFDHGALASALTDADLEDVDANALPIVALSLGGKSIGVTTTSGAFKCKADASKCKKDDAPPPSTTEVASPDGKHIAFVRDFDLWIRSTDSGEETQLTKDGEEAFAYGALGLDLSRIQRRRAGMPAPIGGIQWSPDGRYIASMRNDLRDIEPRAYITEYLAPDQTNTYAHIERFVVADDKVIVPREVAVIDVASGDKVVVDVDSGKLQDFAMFHFVTGYLWWNLDGEEVTFVTANIHGTTYGLTAANVRTGKTRIIVEETEDHYFAFNARDYWRPNFHVTADGKDAIFYSQRSGAGHLYFYDAGTGKLKSAITDGNGVVFDLIRIDEDEREIYFTAGGRKAGQNPYHTQLYRVSFDGGDAVLLTPEDAVHEFHAPALPLFGGAQSQFSPSGKYFVDVYSTIEQPPKMIIRDKDGEFVADVLEADISALEASGWKPPERFVVKAADGKTDLYGALFKPTDFDPGKKYAVVDQTYPGPQIDSGPHSFAGNFAAITTNNAHATAEAGFIVVALDGRGTTRRDKDFRYAFAGTEDLFGAADHKAAIENLARKHAYVDASRVGITGASFGGYGSVRAALLFPGFFDVVVSHVGPHEYRRSITSGFSTERFFGVPDSDRDYHDLSSNIAIIDRLEADLMLVYGEIDENVPFRSAIAIFDALIKADKDFTSYVVPNANHGAASRDPYIVKRQRRFFYEHLGGPKEMPVIDHVILNVPDLEAFATDFTRRTGVELTFGGAHPDLGTANLLASLGDGMYLEVLGPNPELAEPSPFGRMLAALDQPQLAWYAAATKDMAGHANRIMAAGFIPAGPSDGSRETPDGTLLSWQGLIVTDHDFGDLMPFFIDWQDSPHPSTTSASGIELVSMTAYHPDADGLRDAYKRIGIRVDVVQRDVAGYELELNTPNGPLRYHSEIAAPFFTPLMSAPTENRGQE